MPQEADLNFDFKPTGRNGMGILRARLDGERTLYTVKCDPTIPEVRETILTVLARKRKGIDRAKVEEALEEIAAECLGGDDIEQEKLSQGQHVTKLAEGAELFHCGETAYATVNVHEEGERHNETYSIGSVAFQRWLEARFFRAFGRPATSGAISDAINALSGRAIFHGPEKQVAIRLAHHDGSVYLDLADDTWRAVRITPRGWSIVAEPPVKFLRRKGMAALPTPAKKGAGIDLLRAMLNVRDESQFVLLVAWLLGALHPTGPYPVLAINGEHGSAKSTATKMLRRLIDPNKAMVRSLPRDERDLMIQASNSWICAYDNVSGMRRWVSDALCCLATGGGFGTRKLHTDDEEMLFDVKRPVILNGIEEDATKEDLLDRTIQVSLLTIADEARRTEAEVWDDFDLAAPEILGGLLDAAACAMANVGSVKLDRLPRMADFAKWIVAAEQGGALGWEAGTFMSAYGGNRAGADEAVIEQSAIGAALLAAMDAHPEPAWEGSAQQLLKLLKSHADQETRDREDWPKTVQKFTALLRRIAPAMRRQGINFVTGIREAGGRKLRLTRDPKVCAKRAHLVSAPSDMPFSSE